MENNLNVSIGIQARSTSTRFPNKISEMIAGRMVIEHVIDACKSAAQYINRYNQTNHISCSVSVLIPKDDPIKYSLTIEDVIEGSEHDVLSRYMTMAKENDATHVVSVTGDCPLIPPFLIYKCINSAIKNGFDYFSNVGDVDDDMRTSIDGHDVEVISARALEWADKQALSQSDREHVTTILRHGMVPSIFKRGILIGHNDHSNIKLSIDTREDLERIRLEFDKIQAKIKASKARYGKHAVHRF